MEQLKQLDLTNPNILAAIAAVAALILIGIIIGFVRGRKKRAPEEAPPAAPPEALEAERPKIEVPEPPEATAEPTQPIQIEDLVPGVAPEPLPTLIPEPTVVPPPRPPADLGHSEPA